MVSGPSVCFLDGSPGLTASLRRPLASLMRKMGTYTSHLLYSNAQCFEYSSRFPIHTNPCLPCQHFPRARGCQVLPCFVLWLTRYCCRCGWYTAASFSPLLAISLIADTAAFWLICMYPGSPSLERSGGYPHVIRIRNNCGCYTTYILAVGLFSDLAGCIPLAATSLIAYRPSRPYNVAGVSKNKCGLNVVFACYSGRRAQLIK